MAIKTTIHAEMSAFFEHAMLSFAVIDDDHQYNIYVVCGTPEACMCLFMLEYTHNFISMSAYVTVRAHVCACACVSVCMQRTTDHTPFSQLDMCLATALKCDDQFKSKYI